MKGSLVLDKISDRDLQLRWRRHLAKLDAALKVLRQASQTPGVSKLEYLELALRFSEARDEERNFFWDAFVEQRTQEDQTIIEANPNASESAV